MGDPEFKLRLGLLGAAYADARHVANNSDDVAYLQMMAGIVLRMLKGEVNDE